MSRYVWQDAWVLLALRYAQGGGVSASRQQLEAAGDVINHAPILDSELAHAVEVLGEADLMHVEQGTFRLGQGFAELWARSGAGTHRDTHKQLEALARALSAA
jgi:hypothetical protein